MKHALSSLSVVLVFAAFTARGEIIDDFSRGEWHKFPSTPGTLSVEPGKLRLEDAQGEPEWITASRTFAVNFEEHDDLGASVAVTFDGAPVVDLWGGTATFDSGDGEWQEDTIINVWSTTKTMAACSPLTPKTINFSMSSAEAEADPTNNSASATVNVGAPPQEESGGGGTGLWLLPLLGVLAIRRRRFA